MDLVKKSAARLQIIAQKINTAPLFSTLFLLLLFYLPFQHRYHRPLKHIYRESFSHLSRIPFNFDKALYFYITDFLMIALILKFFLSSKFELKKTLFEGSAKYLSLFILLSFVSVITSPSHSQLWVYYRWTQLLIPMLLFYAISQTLDLTDVLKKAFWVIFAVTLFECGLVCIQYMSQTTLGLKGIGEGAMNTSCTAFFSMPDKSRWLLDKFFQTSAPLVKILRAPGTFPHPNILGGFMGFSLFSSYYLFVESEKRKLRISIGAAIILQLFVLCLTFSRAAILGSVLCTLLWFSLCLIRRKHLLFDRVKSLALVLFTAFSLSFILLYPQFLQRGGVINYNQLASSSDSDRIIYQNISFEMIKEHPIKGVGFNHFHLKMEEMNSQGKSPNISQIVHNIYLLIAAEMGIPALLIFLSFIISLVWRAIKQGLNSTSITLLSIFLFLLWIGLCDHYPFTGQHGKIMLFVAAGLLAGCLKTQQDKSLS